MSQIQLLKKNITVSSYASFVVPLVKAVAGATEDYESQGKENKRTATI